MTNTPQQAGSPFLVQFIAVAEAFSNFIYAAVALVLRRIGSMPEKGFAGLEPEITRPLSIVLLVVGAGALFLATFLRRAMSARLTPETDNLQSRLRITLAAGAIANNPGVCGLALAFLGGLSPTVWLLWGMSFCGAILVFPTRAWLEYRADAWHVRPQNGAARKGGFPP